MLSHTEEMDDGIGKPKPLPIGPIPKWAPLDPYRYWGHSYWFSDEDHGLKLKREKELIKEYYNGDAEFAEQSQPENYMLEDIPLFAFHFENAGWLPEDIKNEHKAGYTDYVKNKAKKEGETNDKSDEEDAEDPGPPPNVKEFELFYETRNAVEMRRHILSRRLPKIPDDINKCITMPSKNEDIQFMKRANTYPRVIPPMYPEMDGIY